MAITAAHFFKLADFLSVHRSQQIRILLSFNKTGNVSDFKLTD